jgi:hypothetical protein
MRSVLAAGQGKINVNAVAAGAHTGKAAIYRRWPTVIDCIIDAVAGLSGPHPTPDTGDPRTDLQHLLRPLSRPWTFDDSVIGAAVTIAVSEPDLRACIDTTFIDPLRHSLRHIVSRYRPPATGTTSQVEHRLAVEIAVAVAEGWWCRRYLLQPAAADTSERRTQPGPDVDTMIDKVLLPLLGPGQKALLASRAPREKTIAGRALRFGAEALVSQVQNLTPASRPRSSGTSRVRDDRPRIDGSGHRTRTVLLVLQQSSSTPRSRGTRKDELAADVLNAVLVRAVEKPCLPCCGLGCLRGGCSPMTSSSAVTRGSCGYAWPRG